MTKFAIIGCGYIGCYIAKSLKKENNYIVAACKNQKELENLSHITQKNYLMQHINEDDLESIIKDIDIIILTITSDDKKNYESTFLKTANQIIKAAKKINKPKKLIYTSRCEIYGEQNGKWAYEDSKKNPLTNATEILIETENQLLELETLGWDVTILRLSEVYGPSFEISKKIKKFSDYFLLENKDNYTNMVHLEDIVSCILYIIHHNLKGIYNLSDNDHMSQEDLMNISFKKLNLPSVDWKNFLKHIRGNYRVSNNKIKEKGYSLIHPKRIIS